ncbi:uncharacterized protein LOC128892475 [Hylaeus anthracinus]|uniref:uncharacterized protein LOC128892475 n=1 Tax=Hylaeus anthracinus TaxID=313031 RepID=UPI0023B8B50C|nr:uncharacterized protein LOC128892475 [Hylaeus anthracinus]
MTENQLAFIVVPRFARRKQKSHFSRNTSNNVENDSRPSKLPKDARLASNVPKDAAVHFGNFYDVQGGSNKPQLEKTRSSLNSTSSPLRTAPRLEFTRQMVHKLERTAGTEEYARQVSVLLEETVEPPHFKLHSVPAENSIPDGKQNPSGYPLWYKEPYKMPFAPDDIYKLLEYDVDNPSRSGKDIFDEESSGNDSCEEASDDEQIVENGSSWDFKKEDSVLASGSTTVTEPNDTDSKENDDTSDDRSEKTSSPV